MGSSFLYFLMNVFKLPVYLHICMHPIYNLCWYQSFEDWMRHCSANKILSHNNTVLKSCNKVCSRHPRQAVVITTDKQTSQTLRQGLSLYNPLHNTDKASTLSHWLESIANFPFSNTSLKYKESLWPCIIHINFGKKIIRFLFYMLTL